MKKQINLKNSKRIKILSFIVCFLMFLGLTSFHVSAQEIKETKTTPTVALGSDITITEKDFSVKLDFSQDRNKDYTLKEIAQNKSKEKKICNQTFVFLNKEGKVVDKKSVCIVASANQETVVETSSIISLKVKHEATSYYVSYGIGNDSAEKTTLTDAEKFKQNSEKIPYFIEDYSVNVKITETNKIIVSEELSVHYNEMSKGITKVFLNGKYKADASVPALGKLSMLSISCDGEPRNYTLHKKGGVYSYNTGLSPDMLGTHTYEFTYEQSFGKDRYDNFDKIFFSLNNGTWGVPINNMSFSIEFPKEYKSSSEPLLCLNSVAQDGTGKISFEQKDNVIKGEAHLLNGTDFITFSANVNDGYFIAANEDNLFSKTMLIGLCMVILFMAFIAFSDRGEEQYDEEIATNYDIPLDLYAFELEYIHKHSAIKGLSVLLLQLVNEGYIRIEPSPVSKADCLITKLKDYDGDNEVVATIFDIVFGEETETDIEEFKEAYTAAENAKVNTQIKAEPVFDGVFAKFYQKKNFIFRSVALFILFALALIPFAVEYCGLLGAFALIIAAVLFTPFHCYIIDSSAGSKLARAVSLGIIGVISTAIAVLISCLSTEISNLYVLAPQISIMIIFYIMLAITAWNDKQRVERTKKGRLMEQEILSFIRFVSFLSESQAISISKEAPDYFFKALPYVYTLCETDAEIERFVGKFKDVEIASDKWSDFSSAEEFYEFVDNIVKSTVLFISVLYLQNDR